MGTTIDPSTLCKLCCAVLDSEELYRIFETSVILANRVEPEPICPIICDLLSVKVDKSDVIQTICLECINCIQQWKEYLDNCWEVQLALPEEMRMRKADNSKTVDENIQTDSVTVGEVSESGLCGAEDDAGSKGGQSPESGPLESPPSPVSDKTKVLPTPGVEKPSPLSKKKDYTRKQKENCVRPCSVSLQRLESVSPVVPSPSKAETGVKPTPVDMDGQVKKRGRPPKALNRSGDSVITPVKEIESSLTNGQEKVNETEASASSRSKRTPKPKQIFDPSESVKKPFSALEKKYTPKKKAKFKLSEPKVEDDEDSGEYTIQINMGDDENDNPHEIKEEEPNFIFVTADDGGLELVRSDSALGDAKTTISLNGEDDNVDEEPEEEEEEEEIVKKKVIRKRRTLVDSDAPPASKRENAWAGLEFTPEFIYEAVDRPLTDSETEIVEMLVRRRRFRELWVMTFIGSVKGANALKHRKCNVCGEVLDCTTKGFEKHMKLVHDENAVFVCEYCGMEVEGADQYYDHWEDHLQHYACRGCKFYFTTREERDEHKLSEEHLLRQRRSSRRPDKVGTPFTKSKENRPKSTPFRPPKTETKKGLQEGMEVECPICGVDFPSRSDLKIHMADEHSEGKETYIPPLKKRGVEQPLKKKLIRSVNIDELYEELDKEVEVSPEDEVGERLSDDEGEEGKGGAVHTCPVCEATFDNLRKLSNHLVDQHDRLRGPLLCELCDLTFKTEIEAKKHRTKVHYNQGDLCKLCKKWIGSKKGLEQHMKRHLGEEKLYDCYRCSKSFSREEYLKAHEDAAHSEGTCYECALCSEKFSSRRGCLTHIREHGDFDNYAQFVQEVQVLQQEDDTMDESEIYFAEETDFTLEDSSL